MPLGAARIALFSRPQVVAQAEVIRAKVGVSAVGNAQIDTAQSQFGGSSYLGDTSSFLTVDNFLLNKERWTVECWVYQTDNGSAPGILGSDDTFLYTRNFGAIAVSIEGSRLESTNKLSLNQWQHIAYVLENNFIKIYLDGNLEVTYDATGKDIFPGSTLTIARVATFSWVGNIDEVRISNTARYTANFTPPTEPFQNDENTLLLLHMDGTPGSQFFEDDNGARKKQSIYAEAAAQISTADSQFGGASFVGDRLNKGWLNCQAPIIPESTPFTLECWFNADVVDNDGWIITQYDDAPTNGRNIISLNNGKVRYFFDDGNIESADSVSADTWHHVAVVRDENNEFRIYLDGVQGQSQTSTQLLYQGRNTYIGKGVGGSNNRYFDGYIDEVRISNTARYTTNFTPQTEPHVNDDNTLLLLHMDGTDGSQLFEDDNGVRQKVGVSAVDNAQISTTESQFGGASAEFTGSASGGGGALSVGNGELNWEPGQPQTLELWMRSTDINDGDNNVIQKRTGTTGWLVFERISGEITFNLFPEGNKTVGFVNVNEWNHLSIVKDENDNWDVYLNGNNSLSFQQTVDNDIINANPLYIGGSSIRSDRRFGGYIDEVRFSNTARYTANFTPPTEPFQNDDNTLLLLHMDGTDGSQTFVDDNGVTPNHDYGA